MQRRLRKILRTLVGYDPDYYDMREDPNERLFARLYVERVLRHLGARGMHAPATILEAGCQTGRLVVPFAALGYRVTGIDTSGYALRRARKHLRSAGVEARLVRGDLRAVLDAHPDWRFDLVMCAEVLYLSREYRAMLRTLARAVRPGGLLCVSHRPKFYYLYEALRQYDVAEAAAVLQHREGSFRGDAYYNWQTEDELRSLYRELGCECLALYPIDRFAWLGGINPSRLTEEQQRAWCAMELDGEGDGAMCARYVLVVAARPDGSGQTQA